MGNHYQRGSSKWITLFSVLLLGTVMVFIGCMVRHGPWPKKPNSRHEIPLFSYEREKVQAQVQRLKEENTHWIEKVTFPSSMAPYWVTAYHYVQKAGGNPPTIIILPILGGNYFFSKNCACYLARRGFSCLRFERTTNPLESGKGLIHTEMVLRHTIIDIRRGIDWLDQRGKVDLNRIGVAGISMGAIVASLALEVEPRINSAAILLGGADIATILTNSKENMVVGFREEVMQTNSIGLEQFYREATQKLVTVDPLSYSSGVDPKCILMINARFDKVIPSPCPEKLWNTLGRPQWIRIPTGHDSSALFLWYIRYRILRHFRKVLIEGEQR